MSGAKTVIQTLTDNGVDICFTNPGTSEMHFVAALDEVEGMRCVLCLFEGVASGAADGYARMAQKPASTLLHLGPGFSNASANIHNAKRGNVPMVNIVGEHASYHRKYDAPLSSDIEGLAAPVSHHTVRVDGHDPLAENTAEAVAIARLGKIANVILPADISWQESKIGTAAAPELPAAKPIDTQVMRDAVTALNSGEPCLVLLGGIPIKTEHTHCLSRIAKSTGASVNVETFTSRLARGVGRSSIERFPYLAEWAIEVIKDIKHLILLGTNPPVSFFAYPNVASELAPEGCNIIRLASIEQDVGGALEQLANFVADGVEADINKLVRPGMPSGELNAESIGNSIAALMPEDTIVVDEGITGGLFAFPATEKAPAHDWLCLTGGAIGWGLPAATGAACACPDRKVLCLEGDGSAMYTIQSLWTMARENLDITTVIFNNQQYAILQMEFARTGANNGVPGPKAGKMLEIGSPAMNFADLARGMGVKAIRVTTAEEFGMALREAMEQSGPFLIDAVI